MRSLKKSSMFISSNKINRVITMVNGLILNFRDFASCVTPDDNNPLIAKTKHSCTPNVMISDITHAYFALPLHVEIVDTGESLDVSGNTRRKYGVRYRTI